MNMDGRGNNASAKNMRAFHHGIGIELKKSWKLVQGIARKLNQVLAKVNQCC